MLPKGTKLNSEVTWDNSDGNPKNPSRPPVRVTWGEQSADEMGSVTLQVVAKTEAELPALQASYRQHVVGVARTRIMQDPGLLTRIRQQFGDISLPGTGAPAAAKDH